ncbi:hypothetical protein [Sphingomonas sp. LR55]|uniref:hypothetical protein n=1 Tax=Sphingomonas sp. LR55 TaxID=3050231 RepID=UPI002FE151AC
MIPAELASPVPSAGGASLADRLRLDDSPRHAILVGGIVAILFFVVGLGWAAFARLDAAAAGEGQVVVAGNRQTVQHREGGIVAAMAARDGQHVRAGDILFRLEGAEVTASERALAASVIDLQAQRAAGGGRSRRRDRLARRVRLRARRRPPPRRAGEVAPDRTTHRALGSAGGERRGPPSAGGDRRAADYRLQRPGKGDRPPARLAPPAAREHARTRRRGLCLAQHRARDRALNPAARRHRR